MREEFVIGISDVHEVAERVLAQFQSGQARVLALYGDIGTGKTTFMQALLAAAGVSGPMQSPTFSYVHRYELKQGIDKPLYHFDLYRLSGKSDFFTMNTRSSALNGLKYWRKRFLQRPCEYVLPMGRRMRSACLRGMSHEKSF